MKRNVRGFTLVEILIVVIILGILAAIVIPQFTNASNDARNNSVASTLQTARSQIELFKIQHADTPPLATAMWTIMLGKSSTTEVGAAAATGTNFGPYLQQAPTNPLNGQSACGASAATTVGWVYTTSANNGYTLQAVNTAGGGVLTY
ncbi:MAG: prepilin-type N-terminal cleavage/methylation domain-containing protein [Phycisphaerae bacterium]